MRSYWQAELRQDLVGYVTQVDNETVYTLGDDLPFYTRYAYKVLNSRTYDVSTAFQAGIALDEVYYPWNRTFEIGFFGHSEF